MKVFISWSGAETKSLAVAKVLHAWLPSVVNAIEPWISTEGLRAGLKWNQELERELDNTSFGIIVVTPWNQGSQWLNFEAGALSKRVSGSESRVAPLLIDFDKPTDLVGPMASYQATLPEKESMRSLIFSINEALGDGKRSRDLLIKAFDICWPALERDLQEIKDTFADESDPAKSPHPTPVVANPNDAMSEILASVRELTRSNAQLRQHFNHQESSSVSYKSKLAEVDRNTKRGKNFVDMKIRDEIIQFEIVPMLENALQSDRFQVDSVGGEVRIRSEEQVPEWAKKAIIDTLGSLDNVKSIGFVDGLSTIDH